MRTLLIAVIISLVFSFNKQAQADITSDVKEAVLLYDILYSSAVMCSTMVNIRGIVEMKKRPSPNNRHCIDAFNAGDRIMKLISQYPEEDVYAEEAKLPQAHLSATVARMHDGLGKLKLQLELQGAGYRDLGELKLK